MTKEQREMPEVLGVCRFKDGTYEVYPHLADVPPSTKYHCDDIVQREREVADQMAKVLVKARSKIYDFIGTSDTPDEIFEINKVLQDFIIR